MLIYYLLFIVFIGILIYAFCSLVILKQQKDSGAFFKHNFTIPMGATYTSKKHNRVFQTTNKKDYTHFQKQQKMTNTIFVKISMFLMVTSGLLNLFAIKRIY